MAQGQSVEEFQKWIDSVPMADGGVSLNKEGKLCFNNTIYKLKMCPNGFTPKY